MKTSALLLALAGLVAAQPRPSMPPPDVPDDVRDFFRSMAESIVNQDSAGFLSHFDTKMPGYDTLRPEIETLLAQADVTSAIEFVSDKHDDDRHDLEVDWVLQVPDEHPRRQVLTCRLERQGRKWKITMLQPVEFFKPTA